MGTVINGGIRLHVEAGPRHGCECQIQAADQTWLGACTRLVSTGLTSPLLPAGHGGFILMAPRRDDSNRGCERGRRNRDLTVPAGGDGNAALLLHGNSGDVSQAGESGRPA